MALRGKKPTSAAKRLKLLLYGEPGSGKTTASIQFPKPYLIDTERGSENDQYVKAINQRGGAVFYTTDPDELITEITSLLQEKHDYQTVIIDPLSTIYNDLLDHAADKVGTDFGRHKSVADRPIKRLLNLLVRLDMNVVITSHAKPKWVQGKDAKGKDVPIQDGMTFDCYGRLDYLFDLVIQLNRRGHNRVGFVRKSRIETLSQDMEINPFNYDALADLYGRAVLERNAVPVQLASVDQVKVLQALIEAVAIQPETVDKWLDKAGATILAEMPAEHIEACIKFCRGKVDVS